MQRPILLSAGGTGGHMIPAAALAAELTRRGVPVVIASDNRGAAYKVAFGDLPFHSFTIGRPSKNKPRFIFDMLRGVFQAYRLMRKIKPAAVIGFGGYPSAPAICAGHLSGVPILVHEQNSTLGRANAMMGSFAKTIAISYEKTRGVPASLKSKLVFTGPLVRRGIETVRELPYPPLSGESPIHILIMGGSQGARVLSTIVPAAFALLPDTMRQRLHIVQQSRAEDLAEARAVYADAGIMARLEPFIADVPTQLAKTHLFIGRAGGTVAEVTVAGRPAIFIPYPHHADQQQKINAEAVAAAGGAWVMTEDALTPETLADRLALLLGNPALLSDAASAARLFGSPNAAAALADLVLEMTKA